MVSPFAFYYDLMSQPSRALYIIFKMSATSFRDCPVALRKGEHFTEKFKRDINRFQKVPCINDNGFKLAESIAILRYVDAKGLISVNLYPHEVKERARVDEFLSWHHLTLRAGCAYYFRSVWLDPIITGQVPAVKKIERLRNFMEQNLDVLENVWLAKTPFLTGSRLTAADVFAACEVEQLSLTKYNVSSKYPKIAAWLKKVRAECNPQYDRAHVHIHKLSEIEKSKL